MLTMITPLPLKLNGNPKAEIPGSAHIENDSLDSSELLKILIEIKNGNFNVEMPVNKTGLSGKIADTINEIISNNKKIIKEFAHAQKNIGKEGRLDHRIIATDARGEWKDGLDSLNTLISELIYPVKEMDKVISAVSKGNLSETIPLEINGYLLQGEYARIINGMNRLVKRLNVLTIEVLRVTREIDMEGKLGGQVNLQGMDGSWKDIGDSLNRMVNNLTIRVRSITRVINSVATGDLCQKLTIQANGEVAQLTDAFNGMIQSLAVIAQQVSNVAREVGVEGKLGGQANVPGASGIWKNLTENVNQLAENLTIQVRSISEVASAVTKGDLTQNIRVDAKGEVKELKDTINQMITNLRETTLLNQDQDWLKSNLAKFNQMLQGQKDLKTVARLILSELATVVHAHYGAFYIVTSEDVFPKLKLFASYAYKSEKHIPKEFLFGEGLVGQCALEKECISLSNIPDTYVKITSGIGKAKPSNLIILPVLFGTNVKAVIELGTLDAFSQTHLDFLNQLTKSIGIVINTIQTSTRTEVLLSQSQSLTSALKNQQDELRRTNDELNDKAYMLLKQKGELEIKNKEVEEARKSLEEKAEQLTLTSKYKSEFLANMSHELRTPLNSLLILAQQLYENPEGNLNDKQTRYAKTIHSCGDDLLELINDILDLSKIESGFLTPTISSIRFSHILTFVESTFKPISETKNLKFKTEIGPGLPESINTDSQRLNQILKNLLSNAFKFTSKGEVKLKIYNSDKKFKPVNHMLNKADQVVAFSITDSGIGISQDKFSIIFEAFQQAEGSTSRKFGGTGLGLSISRGLAELLGGTIELESAAGIGSTFTLYLPMDKIGSPLMEMDFLSIPQQEMSPGITFAAFNSNETGIVSEKQVGFSEMNNETGDDRNNISQNDQIILLIEDDVIFGKILVEQAHLDGLKVVVATNYTEIFNFLMRFRPIAITLDVYLFDISGWKVMDILKNDLNYRHIPIHLISREENKILALKRGAKSFLQKPLQNNQFEELFSGIIEFNSKKIRQLLVVENKKLGSSQLANYFCEDFIEISLASSAEDAIRMLKEKIFDCIILDQTVLDNSSLALTNEFINTIDPIIPVIIYSETVVNKEELLQVDNRANSILKIVDSQDELIEETWMQLHLDYARLPQEKRSRMEKFRMKSDILIGKKIIIVDDDVRNLFAITTVFERYNMNVLIAESGEEAISIMNDTCDIDMVLMDIMMPEMDGYETIRKIRKEYKNSQLPIIAVTAQAMKGERQKCIGAGASDYITKPLKVDQLLSLMRMWLHK